MHSLGADVAALLTGKRFLFSVREHMAVEAALGGAGVGAVRARVRLDVAVLYHVRFQRRCPLALVATFGAFEYLHLHVVVNLHVHSVSLFRDAQKSTMLAVVQLVADEIMPLDVFLLVDLEFAERAREPLDRRVLAHVALQLVFEVAGKLAHVTAELLVLGVGLHVEFDACFGSAGKGTLLTRERFLSVVGEHVGF